MTTPITPDDGQVDIFRKLLWHVWEMARQDPKTAFEDTPFNTKAREILGAVLDRDTSLLTGAHTIENDGESLRLLRYRVAREAKPDASAGLGSAAVR